MQVILIGSGNIAGLMGRLLLKQGHHVQQVFSRSADHANKLAGELKAMPVNHLADIEKNADLYIVAVSDDALQEVAPVLFVNNQLVIHTSGTVSREVLKNCSSAYGVLWPIKMVTAATSVFTPATMVIDGNNLAVTQRIKEIALLFSENVTEADDAKRARMHMAATFTANFSNHLFHLAADYCEKENLLFSDFYPLIEAAVHQLHEYHPAKLQAGPAFRGDVQTIAKHRQLLESNPQMKHIYEVISNSILYSVSHF